jgi:adenylate kinase
MSRIIITGSPGTGKSEIAKALAETLGIELIDIKKVVRGKKLVGKGGEVDIARLAKALAFLKSKRDYVVEGHLACETKLPADSIVVLRTDPKTLYKRLSKRGYGKKKLEENLLAEMLDYCTQRVRAVYHKDPLELDTSKRTVASSARMIVQAIKHKKKRIDCVNYQTDLISYLRLGGQR